MTLYSERLLAASSGAGWIEVVVPTAMRAVIRAIDYWWIGSTAGYLNVALNTTTILHWDLPATPGVVHFDTRAVAYAGEAIRAQLVTANGLVAIHGYLFDDKAGRRAAPAQPVGPGEDLPPEYAG